MDLIQLYQISLNRNKDTPGSAWLMMNCDSVKWGSHVITSIDNPYHCFLCGSQLCRAWGWGSHGRPSANPGPPTLGIPRPPRPQVTLCSASCSSGSLPASGLLSHPTRSLQAWPCLVAGSKTITIFFVNSKKPMVLLFSISWSGDHQACGNRIVGFSLLMTQQLIWPSGLKRWPTHHPDKCSSPLYLKVHKISGLQLLHSCVL